MSQPTVTVKRNAKVGDFVRSKQTGEIFHVENVTRTQPQINNLTRLLEVRGLASGHYNAFRDRDVEVLSKAYVKGAL